MIIELGSSVVGTGIWLAQSARAGKVTNTPPLLSHFRKRREHLHASVSYGNRMLDIWRPSVITEPAPVLMFVPGGAWCIGHRRPQGYAMMSHLVDQGWICLAIDYSTAPFNKWPAHILDVQEALGWARANISNYGGDPNFIAVAGASAGGHLASLSGLAWDWPDYASQYTPEPPDAVVAIYGSYDWVARETPWKKLFCTFLETVVVQKTFKEDPHTFFYGSPNFWIREDAPPFLIIHGTRDRLIPVQEARDFAEDLRDCSQNEVFYYEVPKGVHAFDLLHARQTAGMVDIIDGFLSSVRRELAEPERYELAGVR